MAVRVSLAAALLVLVGGYIFVRSQPPFSADELALLRAELEEQRTLVDGLVCERGTLFESSNAEGPTLVEYFAESNCLEAVNESISQEAGFLEVRDAMERGYFHDPTDSVSRISIACDGLPSALARESESRGCVAVPGSERWAGSVHAVPLRINTFAQALTALALDVAKEDVGGALRLLIQGLAVARNSVHGAPPFLVLSMALGAEQQLSETFAFVLTLGAPDDEEQARLDRALAILEEIRPDPHLVLVTEALSMADEGHSSLPGDPMALDVTDFTSGRFLQAMVQACPAGASVDACVEGFVFPQPALWKWYEVVRTPRAEVEKVTELIIHGVAEAILPNLERIRPHEHNLETLRALLSHAGARRGGECPRPGGGAVEIREEEGDFYLRSSEEPSFEYRFICPLDLPRVRTAPPEPAWNEENDRSRRSRGSRGSRREN